MARISAHPLQWNLVTSAVPNESDSLHGVNERDKNEHLRTLPQAACSASSDNELLD